jgi:DNA-binding MarR family transcriptional regulator
LAADDIGARVVALVRVERNAALLRALANRPLRGNEAASVLGKTEQWAGQLLQKLKRLGLVTRHRDERDRRAWLWEITDDGLAALALMQAAEPSPLQGWVLVLKLGAVGKRLLAMSLVAELSPTHVYRVVGDIDVVAVSRTPEASPDLLADLRRRLHEVAHVEASYLGHVTSG